MVQRGDQRAQAAAGGPALSRGNPVLLGRATGGPQEQLAVSVVCNPLAAFVASGASTVAQHARPLAMGPQRARLVPERDRDGKTPGPRVSWQWAQPQRDPQEEPKCLQLAQQHHCWPQIEPKHQDLT